MDFAAGLQVSCEAEFEYRLMYTDCPGCHRQFHIYATQIAAARGQVKCGFCGLQFDALERLHDQPRVRRKPEITVSGPRAVLPEPDFILPDEEDRRPPARPAAAADETAGAAPASAAGPETGITATRTVAAGTTTAATRAARGGNAGSGSRAGMASAPAASGEIRSAVLEASEPVPEDTEPRSRWLSRLLWGAGIMLMLAFGLVQISWFNRDMIMNRLPQTVPWFNRLCATIACGFVRNRDITAIHLLNRDVRQHPRYQDALLVNATMSNQSQTLQPFPVIQLNLYDTRGNLIAYRQFQPREYLDDSVNLTLGMAPGVPVHFVLEVLDSVAGAVSFEFEFH
jgi:predicted Zn finger-like uncharacterized protein